jgi:L-arabinose isomerase
MKRLDPLEIGCMTDRALYASVVDLGNRFLVLVQGAEVIAPPQPWPKWAAARAVGENRPDFKTACAAWIHAGGEAPAFEGI